jgi:hypothetical protein
MSLTKELRNYRDSAKIRNRFLNMHAESIHAEVTGSMGVLHYYMTHHTMNAAVRKSKMIHASEAPDRSKIIREIQEYEDIDKISWSKYN